MGQDPAHIRAEIEETLARLDETVDALTYKADIPARLNDSIAGGVESATAAAVSIRERLPGTETIRRAAGTPAGVAAGALLLGLAAGFSVPMSRFERRRLTPVARRLRSLLGR